MSSKNHRIKKLGNIEIIAIILCVLMLFSSSSPLVHSVETQKEVPADSIIQKLQFSPPTIQTLNGRDSVSIDSCEEWSQPGEPCISVRSVQVLLPYGTSVKSVTVSTSTETMIPGSFYLTNGQTPVKIGSENTIGETAPNPSIYDSSAPYPQQSYTVVGVQKLRGYQFLIVDLFPICYHPSLRTLSYFPEMTLTVTLTPDKTVVSDPMFRGLSVDEDVVLQKTNNGDAFGTYEAAPYHLSVQKYGLLIITTPGLQSHFQRLAEYHTRHGLSTTIRTIGVDIPNSNDASSLRENIRNYIRSAYQHWGIEYVLLGGDSDIIPPTVMLGNYPSDVYYACLDGTFNWNHDGIWGMLNDGENGGLVDLLAEVYVGRASVNTIQEVDHFVDKTLAYMNCRSDDPILKKVLMAGEYLYPGNGSRFLEELIDRNTRSGFITNGIPSSSYQIEKLYDENFPDIFGWPKQELIDRLNAGTCLVNHMGHAGDWWNMKLEFPDVDNLTNQFPFFVYSEGCDSGAFDNPHGYDCIAEHYTVKTKYAAFAGIWYSRSGWIGFSDSFHRQFWDAVFSENISTLGAANQDSKEDNLWQIHRTFILDCYYEIILFGDPAVTFQNRPLHADAHGPYRGLANDIIQFRGSVYSEKSPVRWFWDFGDGNTSILKNPQHLYRRTGVYPVSLTVMEPTGRRDVNRTTATIFLDVSIEGPTDGTRQEPVQFNGSVSGGFTPYSWLWDFGDGNYSTEQNPTHLYQKLGVFLVNATATDHLGSSGKAQLRITIVPETVWVDVNNVLGPWDGSIDHPFTSIQEGLDVVEEFGYVYVMPGDYHENICIYKPVHLYGMFKESTMILGSIHSIHDLVAIIDTHDVVMCGFTIQSSIRPSGSFYISDTHNISISDIAIFPWPGYRPYYGFFIGWSSNVVVRLSRIQNNEVGIAMENALNVTVKYNTIIYNTYGMNLTRCSRCLIYNNDFIDNDHRPTDDGNNKWSLPYPCGGNYWTDFNSVGEGAYDDFTGEFQNITGSDYIVDLGLPNGGLNPYTIDGAGQMTDWYPYIYQDCWWGS